MNFSKGTAKVPFSEGVPIQDISSQSIKPLMKYPNLRLISSVYKIIGWIVLIFGIIALAILIPIPILAIGIFLACLIVFVTLLALSESIMVLIDIEENTRVKQ